VLAQSKASLLVVMDEFRGLDYAAELDQLVPGWETDAGGMVLPHLRDVFVFPTSAERTVRGRTLQDLLDAGSQVSDQAIRDVTATVDPSSTSDLLYTSGTTGKAKGVMLTHDAVLRTAYASVYSRGLGEGYRILYAMPLYHVFGYVEATIAVLFARGSFVPHTFFDADKMLRAVSRHQTHEIMCVPAMTSVLLQRAASEDYDLSAMTTIFSSGTVHPPDMWQRMYEVLGVEQIFTAYGQTETTASTMCTLPGDSLTHLAGTNGTIKPAGIAGDPELGGALAIYKVVDPVDGRELAPDEVGELLAKGPIMTRGYFDKPEETAALFTADGWLRTGDLGRIDRDGYLSLTGRQKESYRFGGELVLPSEVEAVLNDHPTVLEAHVVGLPHERWGDVGCAWVVAAPLSEPDAETLIAYCRTRLARFKVPATVLFVDASELPRTVTGRVQKFHLVERAVRHLSDRPTEPASSG
jgi:fatty-acyl-CoA synthase